MPNNVLIIASAEWTLTGTVDDPSKLFIKGTGTGGINIPSTNAAVAGAIVSITSVTAVLNFPTTTKYYNPFTITWEVSFDGGTTWQGAGASQNVIYVCLAAPTPTLYRTVVHLACSNDGAANADAAVAKTWSLFTGRTVMAWHEPTQSWTRRLYYYRPGTSFALAENPVTVAGLLSVGSSECVGWALLLQDTWRVNGATPVYIFATAFGYGAFLVKDWGALPATGNFYFQSLDFDMKPYPGAPAAPNPYGFYDAAGTNFQNRQTVPGQNTNDVNAAPGPPFPATPNAPAEKVFGNHQFLKYTDSTGSFKYYDPSYGLEYTGATKAACEADFQTKGVEGFGNEAVPSPDPTKLVYAFVRAGAAAVMRFDH